MTPHQQKVTTGREFGKDAWDFRLTHWSIRTLLRPPVACMAKKDEYNLTANAKELDEVQIDISATNFMSCVAISRRLNPLLHVTIASYLPNYRYYFFKESLMNGGNFVWQIPPKHWQWIKLNQYPPRMMFFIFHNMMRWMTFKYWNLNRMKHHCSITGRGMMYICITTVYVFLFWQEQSILILGNQMYIDIHASTNFNRLHDGYF